MSLPTDAAARASGRSAPGLTGRLRAETRSDHDRVDTAFSRFDLSRRDGYAQFLVAQARVLPAVEALLDPGGLMSGWRGRTAALRQDLRDLAIAPPALIPPLISEGQAARWGAFYVLEGSRLGGAVLARRVPDGLPTAFLGAAHPPGAWRELLARLDALELSAPELVQAVQGAKAVFAAFARSAEAGAGEVCSLGA